MSYCSLQEEKGKTVRKVRLRIENTWKIEALKDAPKDIIWKGTWRLWGQSVLHQRKKIFNFGLKLLNVFADLAATIGGTGSLFAADQNNEQCENIYNEINCKQQTHLEKWSTLQKCFYVAQPVENWLWWFCFVIVCYHRLTQLVFSCSLSTTCN